MWAEAIWHVDKGSLIWEDWAVSLVEGGQGAVVQGPLPRAPPAEQHSAPDPQKPALWAGC